MMVRRDFLMMTATTGALVGVPAFAQNGAGFAKSATAIKNDSTVHCRTETRQVRFMSAVPSKDSGMTSTPSLSGNASCPG